ncbi:hypothetical protein FAES_pFAES01130 (plasmid) [Fibrella aestuarina BUZ 2]|uniref:Uncharacterized protein n=1 Tax=Fibrella aestuarina BUZ 2 TaxID=1166018 RepID=I0KHL7_9BACT|nr:hypothetical protein FAES_pFAES01130 [Fibrella aestuarina BUZ 2]
MYVLGHLIQLLVGIALTITLMGWCLYRLAILIGLFIPQKRPKRPVRQGMGNQVVRPLNNEQKQRTRSNIPRRTLYSARRERN